MSAGQLHLRRALLGTGRGSGELPVTADESALGKTLAAVGRDSAEKQLLTAVGIETLYNDIGRLPAQLAPGTATTLARGEGVVSAELGSYLNLMLQGRYKDVLPQTLEQLAARNLTVPSELLPALLNYSDSAPLNRHIVFQVIGPRGRQLAAQNEKWHFAAPDILTWEGAQRVWKHPRTNKRQAFLRQLRWLNPTFARELVQSSWKSEPDSVRHSLLRLLITNIQADDEPFFETALDDRSRTVRKEAVTLLASIPNSRLKTRMGAATNNILNWKGAGEPLQVRFPVGVSRLLQRDGVPIHIKSNDPARLRGQQLTAMITATPLHLWPERMGVSIDEIIAALPGCNWTRTLFHAFSEAALRQGNNEWSVALIKNEVKASSVRLFKQLSAEQQDAVFDAYHPSTRNEQDPTLRKGNPSQSLVYNAAKQMTPHVANGWIDLLAGHFSAETEPTGNPMLANVIRRSALSCPPEQLDKFIETLQPHVNHESMRTRLQDAVATARFRKDIQALLG